MVKIEDILDQCVERLSRGETVEQCLASYPEQAVELEPLLRVVTMVSREAIVEPSPEFKVRARYAAQAALREAVDKRERGWFVSFGWRKALATVAVGIAALVVTGGVVVAASANSLPGQPLYAVKTTVEKVQLAFTPSEVGKAKLLVTFADRRVGEIVQLVSSGDDGSQNMAVASGALLGNLNRVAELLETPRTLAAREDAVSEAMPAPSQTVTSTVTQTVVSTPIPTVALTVGPEPSPGAGGGTEQVAAAKDVSAVDIGEAKSAAEVREALRSIAVDHRQRLEDLLERASEKDKPAIRLLIQNVAEGYRTAIGE